ncbi:hypothetical protein MMC22_007452 [Lobaria immixta]|nr:hypothetical protein [Lobaria immixta]
MQIPALSLLSLLSSISLIPSSFGSLRPIHCVTPPSSSDQVTLKASYSGYTGPGYYHITNQKSELNVDLNGTAPGSLVNLQRPHDGDSQIWLIAAVERNIKKVIIINKGTGLYLSATSSNRDIRGVLAPLSDRRLRWTIDNEPRSDKPDKLVVKADARIYRIRFDSAEFPGYVLAQRESLPGPEDPIIVNPLRQPPGSQQSWQLSRFK